MNRAAPDDPQRQLRALLEGQQLAVLATSEAGRPYTSLVAFAVAPDLDQLFFATARATRKYANLTAEPRVALLVDDRAHRESDLQEAIAVTALGRAETVEGAARAALQELFLARHPQLEAFVRDPACALIRVRVEVYYLVSSFQQVVEIRT